MKGKDSVLPGRDPPHDLDLVVLKKLHPVRDPGGHDHLQHAEPDYFSSSFNTSMKIKEGTNRFVFVLSYKNNLENVSSVIHFATALTRYVPEKLKKSSFRNGGLACVYIKLLSIGLRH